MKNKLRLSFVLAMTVALTLTSVVAATGAYDTANDPIVVYSGLVKWAEEVFRPSINQTINASAADLESQLYDAEMRLADAEALIAAQQQKLDALQAKIDNLPTSGTAAPAAGSSYTVIYLTGGTQLLATSVCSIILRAGAAEVVSPFVGQGLTDLTAGTELSAGVPLSLNHEVIVPRGNDGRGIRITSPSGAYILVQGGYTLVEP